MDEAEPMLEQAKLVCDPSISVADLEGALLAYFSKIGYRNVQEVVDLIKEAKCGWKTAPKAEGLEIWCNLLL